MSRCRKFPGKEEIIRQLQRDPNDTGSPEVQIGILTWRIRHLTEHFKVHRKDLHSRTGLIALVNKRRKLLQYLKRKDPERYQKVLQVLGLRK